MAIDHLSLLADLQHRFHSSIPADLDVAVPTCGEWTVTDLVQHLADVHRWAGGMARGVNDWVDGPTDNLADRYAAEAAVLLDTLKALDPAAECKTLNGPGPVSFWHRRQVHETLIHLYDLRTPLALEVNGVAPEVWADGVDEVVTMYYPRQMRLGRTGPVPYAVRLAALDLPLSWVLGDGEPVATVTAPSRELDLFLWGRVGLAQVSTSGDDAKLAETMALAITP
jgi:uncharacterized protein (TIGR03083 family)